jgi:ADP-ribose pyrophosphatase
MSEKKEMRDKAKVNETREIYNGKAFSFVAQNITLPNHTRTEVAMVRHPGSTAVVPLFEDGKIVMTEQYRHAVGEYLLEIPAGTIEPGESILSCARRELEEETGIMAGKMTDMGTIHILPSYSDEKIHLFLAQDLSRGGQNLDPDEIIRIVEYPLEDVMTMILSGRITDALTILAVQKVWIYLNCR